MLTEGGEQAPVREESERGVARILRVRGGGEANTARVEHVQGEGTKRKARSNFSFKNQDLSQMMQCFCDTNYSSNQSSQNTDGLTP